MSTRSTSRHSTACHDTYNWDVAPMRRVVVGVDGSENSIIATRVAADAARRDAALLEVVFVYQALSAGDYFVATRVLNDTLKRAFDGDLPHPMQRTVLVGNPAHVLTRLAADADLLVVGASGYSGALRRLLGSTAQACVREASCPVLVVPPPSAQFEETVTIQYATAH